MFRSIQSVGMDTADCGEEFSDAPEVPILDGILAQSASDAASLFDSSICILMLTEGDNLVIKAAAGIDLDTIVPKRIPIGKSMSGCVAMRGSPQVFADVSDYLKTIPENLEPYYSGSLASVPLVFDSRVVGLLNLSGPASGPPFSRDDLSRIVAYANHIPVAVKYHRLVQERSAELERAVGEIASLKERLRAVMATCERAEDVLKESEGEYRQLVEQVNEGILISQDAVIKYANPYFIEMSGYSLRELSGIPLLHLFLVEEASTLPNRCDPIPQNGTTHFSIENAVRHKDGRRIDVEIRSGTIVFQERPAALLVVRNITQCKQIEQELSALVARQEALLAAVPDIIMQVDANKVYTWANQAGLDFFGNDVIGKEASYYFEGEQNTYDSVRPLFNGAQDVAYVESWQRRKDGEKRLLAWWCRPLKDGTGQVSGALSSARDITEHRLAEQALRASERKYRTLVENLPQRIFTKDRNSVYLSSNQNYARDLGITPEELIGRTDYDFHPKSLADKYREDDRRIMESGNVDVIEEKYVQDGQEVWVQTVKSPMRAEDGTVTGILGIFWDITDRKRAEVDRTRMQTQLLQAHKLESIGQLAAGIAHEVNTPTQYTGDNIRFLQEAFGSLSRLLVKVRQLSDSGRTEEATGKIIKEMKTLTQDIDLEFLCTEIPRAVEQSLEGVQRITTIVGAMKEFSHPSPAEKVPVDINRCLATTITLSRNEWKYVADLNTELDESLPLVPCLQAEFNQVILNLIINAAHAIANVVGTSGEKGQITVTSCQDGDWVEVRVADTGTGIPEAIRPRVFDPFFTTKELGKGTGQGLAICRSAVVDRLDGTITFETEVGRGTTFIVRLPLRESPEIQGAPDEEAHSLRG
jgi:PAS domain S-box-containing protein